jgi:hypothetical protein
MFRGDFYVRVTLIDGVNDDEPHIAKLGFLLGRIAPKAILVGTRGVAAGGIELPPIDGVRLQYLASRFGPNAHLVTVPDFSPESGTDQLPQYCEACHG